ncbi:MAG TPA: methyltransferase domain-containing protein [Acidobacteriaceae bacterium]|jgi:SAM-dependent methyltransferase
MTVSAVAPRGTFRDPAGSLYFEETRVFRHVRPAFVAEAESFLASALAKKWMDSGRMVSTTIAGRDSDGSLLLEHERIDYPSYPWEWTPGQWAAAGELTLDLCAESLAAGLSLKDATPLNILFRNADPVFVDVLSFDARKPGDPIWLAYGQFVRTFLLPLAANRYLGWPLTASIERRDGYEPTDLYPHLPLRRRWTAPMRSLVTLPHLLEGKANAAASSGAAVRQLPPQVASQVLRGRLKKLRRTLRALTPPPRASRWSDYTTTARHYSAEDHTRKAAFVERALAQTEPHRVLDVGGNTGHYSRIATAAGARVVAWDTDVQAADANWREARAKREPILPLVANIARPTPAVGWQNAESLSLLQRSQGAFDCVMMLGVIHHMLLIDQIPLAAIFDLVRRLTTRWAIIEWVPASDSQFQQLCRGRQEIYGHLDENEFLAVADQHFVRRLVENLPNGRSLWLFETR